MLNKLFQKWPLSCFCCGLTSANSFNLCTYCQRLLLTPAHQANHCYQCGRPLQQKADEPLCGYCITQPPAHDQLVFVNAYTGLLRQLIIQFKFQHKHCLEPILAQLLSQKIASYPLPEAIIPTPLHPKKLNKRGFNQAQRLAQQISHHYQLPCLDQTCQRIQNTRPQSELSGRQRYRNVKNAFNVSQSIPYQHIALIDDVVTTGHTINALSQTIKQYTQVKTISVWCLARGQPDQ